MPDSSGRKITKSIHIVLAAIMNDDDETPASAPTSSPDESPQAPMATAEQGREMEHIWQMMSMVTPTTGTNSQSLKKFWNEFMARFRQFELPLDDSQALMVVCHVPIHHLTKGHTPKEVFSLFLDERAFSVWSVTPSDNEEALLF